MNEEPTVDELRELTYKEVLEHFEETKLRLIGGYRHQ